MWRSVGWLGQNRQPVKKGWVNILVLSCLDLSEDLIFSGLQCCAPVLCIFSSIFGIMILLLVINVKDVMLITSHMTFPSMIVFHPSRILIHLKLLMWFRDNGWISSEGNFHPQLIFWLLHHNPQLGNIKNTITFEILIVQKLKEGHIRRTHWCLSCKLAEWLSRKSVLWCLLPAAGDCSRRRKAGTAVLVKYPWSCTCFQIPFVPGFTTVFF